MLRRLRSCRFLKCTSPDTPVAALNKGIFFAAAKKPAFHSFGTIGRAGRLGAVKSYSDSDSRECW